MPRLWRVRRTQGAVALGWSGCRSTCAGRRGARCSPRLQVGGSHEALSPYSARTSGPATSAGWEDEVTKRLGTTHRSRHPPNRAAPSQRPSPGPMSMASPSRSGGPRTLRDERHTAFPSISPSRSAAPPLSKMAPAGMAAASRTLSGSGRGLVPRPAGLHLEVRTGVPQPAGFAVEAARRLSDGQALQFRAAESGRGGAVAVRYRRRTAACVMPRSGGRQPRAGLLRPRPAR